jgi:hypothetical protein
MTNRPVVMVDRLGEQSGSYRVVGRTSCVRCQETVILGAATATAVIRRGMVPLCLPCGRELDLKREQRQGRLIDPP